MPAPIDEIAIENFIFHVVHHGQPEPILMDETPIDKFEIFFRRRIAEVLNGNQFTFTETSQFLPEIKAIIKKPSEFVNISKKIATVFHTHQDERIKPGVMILVKAIVNRSVKYILIKYDHEEVIYYTQKGSKAVLSEISNTFSKNKDALQKSVVMDLNGPEPTAIVIDKSERESATKFFKMFLGIKRVYDETKLTQKVKESYQELVRRFKDALPTEYTSKTTQHFYDTVQKGKIFEPDSFLQAIFGPNYSEEMRAPFQRELKKRDIDGEEFLYNKNIPKPRQRKFRTNEGVFIQVPTEADDTITFKSTAKHTTITIVTKKLLEE